MDCSVKAINFDKWDEKVGNTCPVDFCLNIMDKARKESCGRDVLCREGTWQAYEIIKDIAHGKPRSDDYQLLLELLNHIGAYASCEMAQTVASTCIDLMEKYEDEWDRHIRRKRCNNLICKGSYTLYVDPQICAGCGICRDKCPSGAIAGGEGLIHVIDIDKCSKSLICMELCPKGAIKKAGAIRPKLPGEPVPVGSFAKEVSSEAGTRRRRRRR